MQLKTSYLFNVALKVPEQVARNVVVSANHLYESVETTRFYGGCRWLALTMLRDIRKLFGYISGEIILFVSSKGRRLEAPKL